MNLEPDQSRTDESRNNVKALAPTQIVGDFIVHLLFVKGDLWNGGYIATAWATCTIQLVANFLKATVFIIQTMVLINLKPLIKVGNTIN